jgi:hypothetical protein
VTTICDSGKWFVVDDDGFELAGPFDAEHDALCWIDEREEA